MAVDRPNEQPEPPPPPPDQPDLSALSAPGPDRSGRWVESHSTELDLSRIKEIPPVPVEGGRNTSSPETASGGVAGEQADVVTMPVDLSGARLTTTVHRFDVPGGGHAYLSWSDIQPRYAKMQGEIVELPPVQEGISNLQTLPGDYSLVLHGRPDGFDRYTASELVQQIRADPSWNGQSIVLFSCETGQGDNPVAQQIADELGTTVWAPTELLWVSPNGSHVVAKGQGVERDGQQTLEPNLDALGTWVPFQRDQPRGRLFD